MDQRKLGFTLAEVLIYLALFFVLCGGFIAVAFEIIDASGQATKKILETQEADFILKKFEWALLPAGEIFKPVLGASDQMLEITRFSEPNQVSFSYNNQAVFINEGFGLEQLNTGNIKIQDLLFEHYEYQGAKFVKASFTINNQNYESIKFLRNK